MREFWNFKLITRNPELKWHRAFIFIMVSIAVFLVIRASDEDRWSDWSFGDPQTMLSVKHWEKEGWLLNKLLFIPQGYAKIVYYFDEPELRQHAHGTVPASSILLSPRLRYTHYPPGYLIVYTLLTKMGLNDIFWFRAFSIMLSATAVILMYMLFCRLAAPSIAFFTALYYVLSRMFIGFADAIANQPFDDLFRFAFMLFIVFSTRAKTQQSMTLWAVAAWITEFMLSLSSFDSVFFVYIWLIGWDFIEKKGFRWKRYIIFALAPIFAHSLQFLQNAWYLGFNDAVNDVIGTFVNKSQKAINPLESIYTIFQIHIKNISPALYSSVIVCILYAFYFYSKRGEIQRLSPIRLLFILFISGLAFFIILTGAAAMTYEARQFLPFLSLLIGNLTAILCYEARNFLKSGKIKPLWAVYFLITGFFVFQFWHKNIFHGGWGLNPWNLSKEEFNNDTDISLAKYIKKEVKTKFESVFFNINGFSKYADRQFVPGYPWIDPMIEYYMNAPILCFEEPSALAKDLEYLLRRSDYSFSPVIVGKGGNKVALALSILGEKGFIDTMKVLKVNTFGEDQYIILDLTDYLNSEKIKWLRR